MLEINKVHQGDCLELMKELPDNIIDSVITDPPYGLSFMNKKWDYDVPSTEVWKECLRVLKPGGHALVACGTRTQHRMAVNIEDAGFEIRDIVAWVYGSGFPKSLNIGKQIDNVQGNERKDLGFKKHTNRSTENSNEGWKRPYQKAVLERGGWNITKGDSEYEGWGTALKPAMELWTLARKPLSEKNIALNVLKWGTGGINIEGCRIGTETIKVCGGRKETVVGDTRTGKALGRYGAHEPLNTTHQGRFPANLILDEEAGEMLDEQSGESISKAGIRKNTESLLQKGFEGQPKDIYSVHSDKGGASRFFYCAKASKKERDAGLDNFEEKYCGMMEDDNYPIKTGSGNLRQTKRRNDHPTVKPIKLMLYLVKLITPKDGLVLDLFMGSGTTAIACKQLNRNFIGIEKDKHYVDIANHRLSQKTLKEVKNGQI